MALLKWDNTYSVNVDVIDNHHKKVIDLINTMHDGIMVGNEQEVVEQVLEDLMQFTNKYFPEEENLLAARGYPKLKEYQTKHQQLTEKVWKMYERYEEGENITNDMMSFLTRWITHHIMSADADYEKYLN